MKGKNYSLEGKKIFLFDFCDLSDFRNKKHTGRSPSNSLTAHEAWANLNVVSKDKSFLCFRNGCLMARKLPTRVLPQQKFVFLIAYFYPFISFVFFFFFPGMHIKSVLPY